MSIDQNKKKISRRPRLHPLALCVALAARLQKNSEAPRIPVATGM